MMKEEVSKILEMVQAGTISAAEGQQLLDAMGAYEESNQGVPKRPGRLRVRVISSDGDKVNIVLPLALVKSGLRLGMNVGGKYSEGALDGIDMQEVLRLVDEMAAAGDTGDIVNVESADGDIVHIYLE
jgi:hypothetical protein